jgi:sec-independent protein translocase protein TatB
MFDIGWTELLVIGIVALIVVGPKDLPGMFRTLGKFTAKARRMAGEFQRAMEDAADETGVKETAKDIKNMTSAKSMGLNKINDAVDKFDKWEPGKDTAKGPATEKLSEERAAAAEKIRQSSAEAALKRQIADAEAVAAEARKKLAESQTPPPKADT